MQRDKNNDNNDDDELLAFERNHFVIENFSTYSAAVRDSLLLNTHHVRARNGALVAGLLTQARPKYQEALAAVRQSISSKFTAANPSAKMSVESSAISLVSIAGALKKSSREINTNAGADNLSSKRKLISRASSFTFAQKRPRSDMAEHSLQQQQQPPSIPAPNIVAATAAVAPIQRVSIIANGHCSEDNRASPFVTAKQQLQLDNIKRHGINQETSARPFSTPPSHPQQPAYQPQPNPAKRFALSTRRTLSSSEETDLDSRSANPTDPYLLGASRLQQQSQQRVGPRRQLAPLHAKKPTAAAIPGPPAAGDGIVDDRLKNVDPKMIEMIENEILTTPQAITWDDIAGLGHAKRAVHMAVIYPLLKPELFQGIRAPPKGLLLFGPPGTGKTLIARCIASQAGATFFNISASSLTSKWIGEGEKMVRALFAVARVRQPTVIFIDEIDSLLTQRTDGEQEATRRIKTEFLVQLDGCGTSSEDRIILLGATNRPQELDEAARRRFPKRLLVPLPDRAGRRTIVANLMRKQVNSLTDAHMDEICDQTNGYSGADMDTLCREAAYGPIRSIVDITTVSVDDVRPIAMEDFAYALTQVRPSVSPKDLEIHIEFNKLYGMSVADG